MGVKELKVTQSLDEEQWRKFVFNHPYGNVFQTPEMAEVYERTKNHEPIFIATVDDTEEPVAILLAVVVKHLDGFLSDLSSMAIVQGAPLYYDSQKESLKLLIDEYNALAKKKCLFTEIRNMWDVSDIELILNKFGYSYEEHLNFLIDLNRSSEEIWGDIHKSRRKGINRAEKKGIVVEEMRSEELRTFYDVVGETYKNVRIPLPDYSLFQAINDVLTPKRMAKFYVAKHEGDVVGARLVLDYKDVVYDLYAGSYPQYMNYYVNEALVWHILKEHANERKIFDFGGAGKPDKEYGPREFKRRFGGELVNFGRYSKVHSPLKMKVAEKGFKIYQKIM